MTWLFSIGLHNAAVAILLAIPVWGITRIWKKPPVAHLLWLLVLVKLVTPPLVNFELLNWPFRSAEAANELAADLSFRESQPVIESSRRPLPPSPEFARGDAERPPAPDDDSTTVTDDGSQLIARSAQRRTTAAFDGSAIRPVLTWIWMGGAGLVVLIAGIRIVQFHRMLTGTLPAPQRLQSIADALANRMGLRRSPDVRVVDGVAAPLAWCLGRRAMVILPLRLLGALDEDQMAMVLAHELAHLRRRDHWVRVFELIVSALYWWHPLVWWVRRQLHAAEEQCCDAWVAWAYPDRSQDYAQSLFKTAELLSSHPPLVGLASPFLNPYTLKERIEMVLKNRSERRASRGAALGLVLLAIAVIPVGVRGAAQGQRGPDERRTESAAVKVETKTVTAPAEESNEQNRRSAIDGAKAETTGSRNATPVEPISKELQPFQGTWNFGACESVLWSAELDEIQKTWKWVIQGQEITWTRGGNEARKLSFTVDPGKTPKQIDFTFLDGPDKGQKCRGIYEFERNGLWICMTEPGANVPRPEKMAMSSDSETALIILHKNQPVPGGKADAATGPSGAKAKSVAPGAKTKPVAPELSLLLGAFDFERLTSEKWPAKPDEYQKWQWTIQGREIIWTRPAHEAVRLSFTVDPTASPRQIDLTFLNGPDKGEKCQGIYFASRHEIQLCFQDPGAKADRPTNSGSKPGSGHTSLTLVPAEILPLADEVEALQGVWKFDIYYSDWWPERISDPPVSWAKWRWTVKGNEIRWTGMKVPDVKLSFTVDPSKSPRQIDLTFLDGPHKGKKLLGMYRFFAEDGCYICFADPEAKADRPTRVEYSTNLGQTMVSIERTAPEKPAAETPAAKEKVPDRGPEIDAAIARLRQLGAFVREFHPRGDPQYWVQIISTGVGPATRPNAENFDDAAMDDMEIIGRGVAVQLHLRNTSVTTAGLKRLATAGRVDMLELTGSNVDDGMLKVLPKLPLRGHLGLSSDLLTNAGIQPVSECRELTGITLGGRRLTDDCLEQLTGLPKLRDVSLGKNFTRAAFKMLGRLESLTSLDVSELAADLNDLKQVPNLRRLSLSGKAYDDEAARTIADTFQSLEEAYLRRTSITNAGVKDLSRLTKLKILTLDDSLIDDGVADSIRKMKQLTWLSVENCTIGDDTLAALSECPDVWYVFLVHTPVTDGGIAHLAKLKKPLALYLASCKGVTDASIKSLAQLPDSESLHLNLQDSGITEEGARQLQAALPHAQIRWGVPAVRLK